MKREEKVSREGSGGESNGIHMTMKAEWKTKRGRAPGRGEESSMEEISGEGE